MKPLKQGQYLKGNEPLGCFNSGHAPVVFRSKLEKNLWVVGFESEVLLKRERWITKYPKRRVVKTGKLKWQRVYIYRSWRSALVKYQDIQEKRYQENLAEHRKVKELQSKARSGDLGAALKLGLDY